MKVNNLNNSLLIKVMIYMGECEFCGRQNINPPSSDFLFSCHHNRNIVSCINPSCYQEYINTVCNHELNTKTFCNYTIWGNKDNIRIPRSNGEVSNGSIKRDCDMPPRSNLMIYGLDIMFYTEFTEVTPQPLSLPSPPAFSEVLKCKHVSFSLLSRINLHLPLVKIHQSIKAGVKEKERLNEFQNKVNKFCLLHNQATRMIIFSHIRKGSTFNIFPREIISLILLNYYQSV